MTCNSNSTDKPKVDCVLILLRLSISAPCLGYLKLVKLHRMERSLSKDARSADQIWHLLHKGWVLTHRVIHAPQMVKVKLT